MVSNKRIFHLAGFDLTSYTLSFYSCDRKISDGLIRNNNIVKEFSYNDMIRMNSLVKSRNYFKKKGHEILYDSIKKFDPHIIFLGHVNLTKEVIKNIKSISPRAKILAWYVDPPEIHRMKRYKILEPYIDVLFLTSGGQTLKNLRNEFQNVPKLAFFPNPTDEAVDNYHAYKNQKFDYDVMYCGSDSRYKDRRSFLEEVIRLTPDLNWFIAGSLGKPKVFGSKYYRILKSTKFGINISKFTPNNFDLYSSDRISQLTGNGLLTFNQSFPNISKLFTKDEIVVFNNANDLAELLNYYHFNQEEAFNIAKRGRARAHLSYSSTRIAKYMLETIYDNYSETYEWQDDVY